MYRYVSARWRVFMQLATLLATALIGLSIALTPSPQTENGLKLTAFEHAVGSLPPAIALMLSGTLGFICEYIMSRRGIHNFCYFVVSMCHATGFGLFTAYAASSLTGLIRTGHWYAFAVPVTGVLLAFLHLMYLQRRRGFAVDARTFE